MTLQEALKILIDHQKWRLGDDEIEATNPKDLTKEELIKELEEIK